MMEKSLGLLFFLKQDRHEKKDEMYIYLRITVDGISKELSTKRLWFGSRWNVKTMRAEGNKQDAKSVNALLDVLYNKVQNARRQLIEQEIDVTAEAIKNVVTGVDDRKQILKIFQEHNDRVKTLIPQEYSDGTWDLFERTLKHTASFIQWKYGKDDLYIKQLNYEFIDQYSFWLKSVRKCQHNTSIKYLTYFKKIVLLCVKYGWLTRDPFMGFNLSRIEVDKPYLAEEELARVSAKQFKTQRLSQVRDIFVFSCYTGLAYADVCNLRAEQIVTGFDGAPWIIIDRQKTGTTARIPLLPEALAILKRYEDHPSCVNKGTLLPIPTNQKMNAYLKEIADVCDIEKVLTFHVARHTFATTITLSNNVPIESVAKMLGQKDLRQTQHYAKVVDKKLAKDMQELRMRLELKSSVLVSNGQ